jgi:hypothetical protein
VSAYNGGAPTFDITYTYDEQGNVIAGWDNKLNQAIPAEQLQEIRYSPIYDESGNLLSKTVVYVPSNWWTSIVTTYYSYDQYGNLLSTHEQYTDRAPLDIMYTYDCWEK